MPGDITGLLQGKTDASKSENSLNPDDDGGRKEPKRRSKKGKSKRGGDTTGESQVEDVEDQLLNEYQLKIAQEEERSLKKTRASEEEESNVSQNITLNNDMGKKKKKKLKSVINESDVGCVWMFLSYLMDLFFQIYKKS